MSGKFLWLMLSYQTWLTAGKRLPGRIDPGKSAA
jgi:hypothetical protein